VTGTAGSLSHSDQISVSVGNFSITGNPRSQSIKAGSSATFTITLSSDEFSGEVQLTPTIAQHISRPPIFSFKVSTITLHSDTRVTVTLKVITDRTTLSGTFSIRMTATSQQLTHSTTVTLTVTQHHHHHHQHLDD